jgi:hypothetical protein
MAAVCGFHKTTSRSSAIQGALTAALKMIEIATEFKTGLPAVR